jgi:hypothetical protein
VQKKINGDEIILRINVNCISLRFEISQIFVFNKVT